jgi:CheY-like chemotaxis protein
MRMLPPTLFHQLSIGRIGKAGFKSQDSGGRRQAHLDKKESEVRRKVGVAPALSRLPTTSGRGKKTIHNSEFISHNQFVAQVFLAGKDWRLRALLRAQLIEEGVSVEAFETIAEALARLEFFPVAPALFIADISASDRPSAEVERLALWARRIPTWVIATHTSSVTGGLEGRGFERLLFRPLDLGKLVEMIRQRLK